MHVAVVGCAHGELDTIYKAIAEWETKEDIHVDLLLCCGDFQAVRNATDLKAMAQPAKYHDMQTFWKYYSGQKVAPVLTIFIGGNHEASNYLMELPYGGWVAPNIYFLGYAGVVQYRGVRIAGISGIFKGYDYGMGRHECPPYSEDTKRSTYHQRNLDVFRLKQLSSAGSKFHVTDVFMSHDWPQGVPQWRRSASSEFDVEADVETLIKLKPHFEVQIQSNTLGSPPLASLMTAIKPAHWFAGHMHVKFPALVIHNTSWRRRKDDSQTTRFLSLDKCLEGRQFLEVLRFDDTPGPAELTYDPEWLAILANTEHLQGFTFSKQFIPDDFGSTVDRYSFTPTDTVSKNFGCLKIPENFSPTAAYHVEEDGKSSDKEPTLYVNSQTVEFCQKLGIPNWFERLEQAGLIRAEEPPIVMIDRKELLTSPWSPGDSESDCSAESKAKFTERQNLES